MVGHVFGCVLVCAFSCFFDSSCDVGKEFFVLVVSVRAAIEAVVRVVVNVGDDGGNVDLAWEIGVVVVAAVVENRAAASSSDSLLLSSS